MVVANLPKVIEQMIQFLACTKPCKQGIVVGELMVSVSCMMQARDDLPRARGTPAHSKL